MQYHFDLCFNWAKSYRCLSYDDFSVGHLVFVLHQISRALYCIALGYNNKPVGKQLIMDFMMKVEFITTTSYGCHGVPNYWSIKCLFNSLFRLTTKKHKKFMLLSLCEGSPPVTGGFPTQRDSNMEKFSIWWCHNVHSQTLYCISTRFQH